MKKTIKIVVMLFLTLILNTVVNADSSENNTQESSKNEVEKTDYTLATFTPEFIKNLSDSQIKFHENNIKKNLDKRTITNKAKRMEQKRVLFGLQKEELIRAKEATKRAKETTKRAKEENKRLKEIIKEKFDAISEAISK